MLAALSTYAANNFCVFAFVYSSNTVRSLCIVHNKQFNSVMTSFLTRNSVFVLLRGKQFEWNETSKYTERADKKRNKPRADRNFCKLVIDYEKNSHVSWMWLLRRTHQASQFTQTQHWSWLFIWNWIQFNTQRLYWCNLQCEVQLNTSWTHEMRSASECSCNVMRF